MADTIKRLMQHMTTGTREDVFFVLAFFTSVSFTSGSFQAEALKWYNVMFLYLL